MAITKAGHFEITVFDGGHPIWCEITYKSYRLVDRFDALELADLAYAVERARMEARNIAARGYDPNRVADY